jgi:hypothetical protein
MPALVARLKSIPTHMAYVDKIKASLADFQSWDFDTNAPLATPNKVAAVRTHRVVWWQRGLVLGARGTGEAVLRSSNLTLSCLGSQQTTG